MRNFFKTGAHRFFPLAAMALALVLTIGCASTKPLALTPATPQLDLSKGSVVLFTLVVTNQYRPSCPPYPYIAEVLTAKGKKVNIAVYELADRPDSFFASTAKRVRPLYMIGLQIPPGQSVVKSIGAATSKPMLIMASCNIPLLLPMDLPAGEIVYAGRLDAVNRERQGEELRAGPVVPLVDQAAAGYSGGSFDVKVLDESQQDIELLKKEFPALANHPIKTLLWPPWVRLTKEDMRNAKKPELFQKLFAPAK